MASNIWHAGLICVSPASWPDCGKVRSSWTRSGGGTASSVKLCAITCTAASSNRPFDSTPPEPQSPVVPSHVTQRTAQPTAGFRIYAHEKKNPPRLFVSARAPVFGWSGIILVRGFSGARHPDNIPQERIYPPDFDMTRRIQLQLDGFLNQHVICFFGEWISRRGVIKYVAN